MKIRFLMAICILILGTEVSAQSYTPSPPDWKDISIYFLVTDRFANGDTKNDDFGKGEFKAGDIEYYHGGDLKGLTEKLDYIKGMGFTAIWLTPQVANQWISPLYGKSRFAGFHGYWAQDFYKIDSHLGSMEDYKNFVKAAHSKGIYVIQDIVVNHMGDFYSEDGKKLEMDGFPNSPATPFSGKEKAADFFHFNGTTLETKGFFGQLDDLNTENPAVVKSLIEIFKFWIKEGDIDGYRIDTVKYVPKDFWKVFIPEIRAYAASLGKKDFIIFGEAYDYENLIVFKYDAADEHTAAFTGTEDKPLFNSMLDFSVCAALTKVFAGSPIPGEGNPARKTFGSFQALNDRFSDKNQKLYTTESRNRRVTFFDNHDMLRYLNEKKNGRNEKNLWLVLGALYTVPGIPTVYYGTEQSFYQQPGLKNGKPSTDNRQDLWSSNYNTEAQGYKLIKSLNAIRMENPELTKGSFIPRITDGAGVNLWAFSRVLDGKESLVVFNRGKTKLHCDLKPWITAGSVDLLTGKKYSPEFDIPEESFLILKVK